MRAAGTHCLCPGRTEKLPHKKRLFIPSIPWAEKPVNQKALPHKRMCGSAGMCGFKIS